MTVRQQMASGEADNRKTVEPARARRAETERSMQQSGDAEGQQPQMQATQFKDWASI
jgi:hypothetical protein